MIVRLNAPRVKSWLSATASGLVAAAVLSACAVSDDPAVNAVATTVAIGTAAGLIYSANHYDDNNRHVRYGRNRADNRAVQYRQHGRSSGLRPYYNAKGLKDAKARRRIWQNGTPNRRYFRH